MSENWIQNNIAPLPFENVYLQWVYANIALCVAVLIHRYFSLFCFGVSWTNYFLVSYWLHRFRFNKIRTLTEVITMTALLSGISEVICALIFLI